MKTQCDACSSKEATVFCHTEEMALCYHCDHRAHLDNRPEQHHQRFSIFYPVPKSIPICDVCQETKAFFFCLEHRVVICRICDISLHSKDDFSSKHSRFVLNGAKFCTDDKNDGNNDLLTSSSDMAASKKNGGTEQLKHERRTCNINQEYSTELPADDEGRTLLDLSSDDPYGLCEKGEGIGSVFADTDLGCYLRSLSPKNH